MQEPQALPHTPTNAFDTSDPRLRVSAEEEAFLRSLGWTEGGDEEEGQISTFAACGCGAAAFCLSVRAGMRVSISSDECCWSAGWLLVMSVSALLPSHLWLGPHHAAARCSSIARRYLQAGLRLMGPDVLVLDGVGVV